jgi:hypothetical protein
MSTNKDLLVKGVKILAGTLFLLVLSTYVITNSFKNQDHAFFIPVFGIGIILLIGTIYFGFKGVRTIMRAIFND